MFRIVRTFVTAAALIAPAGGLSAQDGDAHAVLGDWELTMETPRGTITQTISITMDGDSLLGTIGSQRGTVNLENVTLEDGTLRFNVTRAFRGNARTQTFTAMVEGDQMRGTISGGRGGGQEFTASRVAT